MERLLLSIEEAAEVLGVRRSTMFKLLKDGAVTTVSIGRRKLVSADECRRYAEQLIAEQGVARSPAA
jgi:excisionase family DNA binding protein